MYLWYRYASYAVVAIWPSVVGGEDATEEITEVTLWPYRYKWTIGYDLFFYMAILDRGTRVSIVLEYTGTRVYPGTGR